MRRGVAAVCAVLEEDWLSTQPVLD
jgi:hypothetical protein